MLRRFIGVVAGAFPLDSFLAGGAVSVESLRFGTLVCFMGWFMLLGGGFIGILVAALLAALAALVLALIAAFFFLSSGSLNFAGTLVLD